MKHSLKARFNDSFVDQKGVEYPETCQYPCDWCRRTFASAPVGIPISYRKFPDGTDSYQCVEWLCSFECALAFVRAENAGAARHRDLLFRDAEGLLAHIFTRLYPGEQLKPAPDWRLMRSNGGDLTTDELSQRHPYIRTANTKVTPMSVIYQQY